jgi:hypothetical protein
MVEDDNSAKDEDGTKTGSFSITLNIYPTNYAPVFLDTLQSLSFTLSGH